MPSLDYEMFTEKGERGWIGTWHNHVDDDSMKPSDDVLEQILVDETRIFIATSMPKNITRRWTLRLRGQLKPRLYDVDFEFGLSVAGRAKVRIHFLHPCSGPQTKCSG
jgi:beta-glucosidase